MALETKRESLAEIARRVRGDFCKVCKEEVDQRDEVFAKRGICEDCMGRCVKCERDLKEDEARVCAGCRKDHGESERERLYRNNDEMDPRKTAFFGGQVHRDVDKAELSEWRKEEWTQRKTEDLRLGEGRMPATGETMVFCAECYLTVPIEMIRVAERGGRTTVHCLECLDLDPRKVN